jgi:regulator of sigma E protease
MDIIIGLIAFIFVLGIIIIIHEAGHFLFARRVDILCREFAFGMGPLLYKKKKGETLYTIRALPIGGYCAIAGEELEDDPLKGKDEVRLEIVNDVVKKIYIDSKTKVFNDAPTYKLLKYDLFDVNDTGKLYMILGDEYSSKEYLVDQKAMYVFAKQEVQIAPYNRTVGSKRKRDRALVMFGGPLMNFILALVVFFLAGVIGGFPNYASTKLNEISKETPSYVAGLRKGDKITRLASSDLDDDITKWDDISFFMDKYTATYPTPNITVYYVRNGKEYQTVVSPQVVIYSISLISDYTTNEVVIGQASNKSKSAGLEAGQKILKINGDDVNSWKDVYDVFANNTYGEPVKLVVTKNGINSDVTIEPFSKQIMDSQQSLSGGAIPIVKVAMGVSPINKFQLGQSFVYSGKMTASSFGLVFSTLDMLFTSKEVGVSDLSGPLGIFGLAKDVAIDGGFVGLLNLIGLLSVNVGLLNLFPIPALDGGRLVFLGYEAITKKKPNQKVETALITVTMLLLFALMIFVFYNDILRTIGVK